MVNHEVQVFAVVAVLRVFIGHGYPVAGFLPGQDMDRETVRMGLAVCPETVGQRIVRALDSLSDRTAGEHGDAKDEENNRRG